MRLYKNDSRYALIRHNLGSLIFMSQKESLVKLIKSLGDETRLRIIDLLREHGEMSPTDISDRVGKEASTVTKHLSLLKSEDIVQHRREGKNKYYSIKTGEIFQVVSAFEKFLAIRDTLQDDERESTTINDVLT